MDRFASDTDVVHGISSRHTRTRDLVPPIHMTATFTFDDVDDGSAVFAGNQEGYVYTRVSNPTVDLLQEKMARLEAGEDAVATASGMSAIAATAMALAAPGDNFVSCSTLYGGTYALFSRHLKRFGIEGRFIPPVEGNLPGRLDSHIGARTRFLYMETPANPTLDVIDIALWGQAAAAHGIPLVVDNTFASPCLQRPLLLGADVVVHSATKYIGGHGDTVGGLIVGRKETMAHIRAEYTTHFGPALSPFNAWLFLRGIKTLALRMARHSDNALKIARWLDAHPSVETVYYPGLPTHPGHTVAQRQMDRFGGMLAFEVTGGLDGGRRFMNALRLCTIAVSLGDCETLVQHPASMTHHTYSAEERRMAGIGEGLIRMSVGIEDPVDIIADIDRALAAI
jgi:methionine-gamma-lyase